jgi:hypothetical protein
MDKILNNKKILLILFTFHILAPIIITLITMIMLITMEVTMEVNKIGV